MRKKAGPIARRARGVRRRTNRSEARSVTYHSPPAMRPHCGEGGSGSHSVMRAKVVLLMTTSNPPGQGARCVEHLAGTRGRGVVEAAHSLDNLRRSSLATGAGAARRAEWPSPARAAASSPALTEVRVTAPGSDTMDFLGVQKCYNLVHSGARPADRPRRDSREERRRRRRPGATRGEAETRDGTRTRPTAGVVLIITARKGFYGVCECTSLDRDFFGFSF